MGTYAEKQSLTKKMPTRERLQVSHGQSNNSLRQMASLLGNQGIIACLEQQKQSKPSATGEPQYDVRVHRNSNKQEQLSAKNYTHDNEIFIVSENEKDWEHKVGHVVQQKQGLVMSNAVKNGLPTNNSNILENHSKILLCPPVQGFSKSDNKPIQFCGECDDIDVDEKNYTPETLSNESSFRMRKYERHLEQPQLFWRGDDREPASVFKTGFSTTQERENTTEPGQNTIKFRRGGDFDDIDPEIAVCFSDNIPGAAFFPLGDGLNLAKKDIFIYAIAINDFVDTFQLQKDIDLERRRKKVQNLAQWNIPGNISSGDITSSVWQYREFAAHRINPEQIIGAYRVKRNFLDEADLTMGVAFKLGEFIENYRFKILPTFDTGKRRKRSNPSETRGNHGAKKKMRNKVTSAAAYFESAVSPSDDRFYSYSGIVDSYGKIIEDSPEVDGEKLQKKKKSKRRKKRK